MRQGSLIAIAVAAVLAVAAAPAAAVNDPLRPQQWGMSMINVDAAHQVTEGQGATVAVIDTGATFSHPDLQGRLIPGYDFVSHDNDPTDENRDTYHGTHVTGIVAADADNGIGVEGVAPLASVLVVRVLDENGAGTLDDVAAGIDYARAHGVNVINLSLGPDTPLLTDGDQTLTQAVQRALNAGIVVVAAAGNHALPFCEQPSVNGPLLCVGAVDPDGNRAFYSNFSTGSGFGITAPGGDGGPDDSRNIVSTVGSGTGYAYEAGTSQATPHVSGVAALLASVGVRGQAAVNRIEQTAQDRGLPGPDPIYGAGIVDAAAAVAGYSLSGSAPGTVGASTAGTGTAARVSVPRIQRLRTVLRRGLVVRCLSAGSGRCSAYANGGRRRIVAGSRRLLIGRWTTLYARTTRRGRTLLLSALRHHRRIAALVRVRVPGVLVQVRRVSLRP